METASNEQFYFYIQYIFNSLLYAEHFKRNGEEVTEIP